MTGHAESNTHERQFLTFVKNWYEETQRLEVGKPPYFVTCADINTGKTVFESRVIGIENGVLQLEKPWSEVGNFQTIEVSLRYGPEGNMNVMEPHILDLTQDAAPASGKSEPATRKAAATR